MAKIKGFCEFEEFSRTLLKPRRIDLGRAAFGEFFFLKQKLGLAVFVGLLVDQTIQHRIQ